MGRWAAAELQYVKVQKWGAPGVGGCQPGEWTRLLTIPAADPQNSRSGIDQPPSRFVVRLAKRARAG